MSTENTSPEGSTPEVTPVPQTQVFQDDAIPAWVKEAGLQDAHKAGKAPEQTPAAPAVQPATPTQQPAGAAVQPTTPVQQPVTPAAADPVAIARAVAEGIRSGQQPTAAEPTQAEIAQKLGIVTLTPESYKRMYGVDAQPGQVEALNEYGQSIAKQAVTIASVLFGEQIKNLRAELTPYTAAVRSQEAARIKSDFYAKNKDLAGYEAIVTQQYELAKAAGKTFPSIEAAALYVADQTRSTLKSLGITPGTPAPANGSSQSQGKAAPQSRPMTPTMVGGKGGGQPSAATPKTTNQAVWGT